MFSEDLVTIIIPSYNTCDYLKNTYLSIRKYYPDISIIMIDDASEDNTKEWLTNIKDDHVSKVFSNERLGHTYWYDEGMRMSKTEIVTILHSDMIIGPNYLENMFKHLDRGKVVCATRVEPPIHPGGKEKIVKNFGLYSNDFKWDEFEDFCLKTQWDHKGEISKGIFAPWMLYKQDHLMIGGHDQNFAPYGYEDSDIFNRWILSGYEMIQSRDSLVYHLTCRGHRWNKEIGNDNPDYAETMTRGRKYFIRKWNQWILNDEYQMPIIYSQYDITLVLENKDNVSVVGMSNILSTVEPWVCRVIVYSKMDRKYYLEEEQSKSKLDLSERIIWNDCLYDEDISIYSDVVIRLDMSSITSDDMNNIIKMNQILENLETEMGNEFDLSGDYEIGNLKVRVNKLTNIVKENILC